MFLSNGQTVPAGAVDRLGDRTPIFADSNYYAQTALGLSGNYATYSAVYKSQLWVRIVVQKLAMATARMPFEVKLRVDGGDSVNEEGDLSALLARPNPHLSGFKLWEWTSSTRDVYGEAFWLKLRDRSGRVRELHPMHPTNVIVKRLADGAIGYVYSNGSVNTSELPVIPETDVVAFTTYNPDNILRGLSTLEALRMTLLNEDAARRATAGMWANGARPGVMLSTDRTLTEGAAKRLKAQFDSAHAGADNTGKTVVFEEGIKPTIVQLSAEEMQYIESRKLNREEVCAAYDVPPPVVHILDHATFSNITEQLRSQYRDTMAPRFVNFESVIDHQLVPDFYPTQGVFTRFNMEEVLRGDFETKATATGFLRNNGVATGNEVRAMFGLPKSRDPEMDKVFANAALVELGTAQERITATEELPPGMNAEEAADGGELIATPVARPNQPTGQPSPAGVAARPPAAVAVPVRRPPLALPAGRGKSIRTVMGQIGRAAEHGHTVKTWVTAPDCYQHQTLNGEKTGIVDVFTNGMRAAADTVDGTAHCECDIAFGQE
jgi:HK97 family phage portal protein